MGAAGTALSSRASRVDEGAGGKLGPWATSLSRLSTNSESASYSAPTRRPNFGLPFRGAQKGFTRSAARVANG